jgi:TPR repeat protein
MYDKGRGVLQDYKKAVQWYAKAADQGDAWAQNNLGFLYLNSLGVPQDYVQAYKWFNLSAAQGLEMARKNREIVLKEMTPDQIAEGQRLSREAMERMKRK